MVSVTEIRKAQRAEGPATIFAIGTATPPNCVEQSTYPDYYFRITNSEHKTELKEKFQRMCKSSFHDLISFNSLLLFISLLFDQTDYYFFVMLNELAIFFFIFVVRSIFTRNIYAYCWTYVELVIVSKLDHKGIKSIAMHIIKNIYDL